MRPKTKSEGSPSRNEPPGKTPSVPQSPATIPSVPDYDLLRRIGGGAYGEVWLARSKATGVLRAAKIVWRHTFEDERPFRREFEGIQRFEQISREHPGQLAMYHIGRNDADGYFYYVMELADNLGTETEYSPHTLRADLEEDRLPAGRVLEIGLALTEALGHLHDRGLIHRDVKPSNVIFVNGRPKLADIGLVTDASDSRSIVGTEGYLSPEGLGTPQGDIFALGKVLYEAATGMDRREFPDLPPDIRTWSDAAQVFELNEIILKACALDLKQRYQRCGEIHADLGLLERGKSVKQRRTRQRYWTIGKRAAVGLIAVAAFAAVVGIWLQHIKSANLYPDGPPSTNMDANTLCAKGLLIIRGDNYSQFAEAYTNFHEAIQLDSHFAQPYVGLLELRWRESVPNLPPVTPEEFHEITDKLEALAPNLAATMLAKSVISYFNWDYPAARQYALQAIRTNPSYEPGHMWYGYILTQWGRPIEGRQELEKARELAPSKVSVYVCLGHTYYLERNFTNAILWFRKALALQPHHVLATAWIGESYKAMGDYSNAFDYSEQTDILNGKDEASTKQAYDVLRGWLAEGGKTNYWQHEWKWTENDTNGNFYWKAMIQINLGHTNDAFYWLNRSYEARETEGMKRILGDLLWDECWDGVHDDLRFKKLLEEVGFTKVMSPEK